MNTQSNPPNLPRIDAVAIRTYCDVVFGYLDGLVPIRALSETGTPSQTPHLEFPSTGQVAHRLIAIAPRAAEKQRGVYVVPGTVRTAGSAKAADIFQTGVMLVDLDTGDIAAARDHLVQHLGKPTLEVASGGVTEAGQKKLHLYWRLTEPAEGEDLTLVARLRATLAAKVGGDRSFDSIHQPSRVPGTIHGKNGKPAEVRLIAHDRLEYDLSVGVGGAAPSSRTNTLKRPLVQDVAIDCKEPIMPVRAAAANGPPPQTRPNARKPPEFYPGFFFTKE